MSRRAVALSVVACAFFAAAAAAYLVVGGLPGLLYAAGTLMVGFFVALKLGVLKALTDPREGRWKRKSVVIVELRSALEDREQCVKDLRCQLEQEAEEAWHVRVALEARIGELERARDGLQGLLDEERARFEGFLGELTGGIGQRGNELDALDRELTALVGG